MAEAPNNPAFASVDLLTAELEMTGSIYEGFSTAIVVKGEPRTVALCREYADAVQIMAMIEREKTAVHQASPTDGVTKLYEFKSATLGVTRLERWPEGLVLWSGGEIAWRSWGPKAERTAYG